MAPPVIARALLFPLPSQTCGLRMFPQGALTFTKPPGAVTPVAGWIVSVPPPVTVLSPSSGGEHDSPSATKELVFEGPRWRAATAAVATSPTGLPKN